MFSAIELNKCGFRFFGVSMVGICTVCTRACVYVCISVVVRTLYIRIQKPLYEVQWSGSLEKNTLEYIFWNSDDISMKNRSALKKPKKAARYTAFCNFVNRKVHSFEHDHCAKHSMGTTEWTVGFPWHIEWYYVCESVWKKAERCPYGSI